MQDTQLKIKIGIDAAASSFFENNSYNLKIGGQGKNLNNGEMVDWYEKLVDTYPIISIEDGLAEDDWQGFSLMNQKLGSRIKIVGDDLLVTNVKKIQKAIDEKAVSSVLIKPNQIGTLTETIEAIELSKKEGPGAFCLS